MSDEPCTTKIRPFPSGSPITEVGCGLPDTHAGEHSGVLRDYAYPGSATTLSWFEGDRRSFRGPWSPCDQVSCTLPHGHRGNHAT